MKRKSVPAEGTPQTIRLPGGAAHYLETLRIDKESGDGRRTEDELPENYFLDRLSEIRILKPMFADE